MFAWSRWCVRERGRHHKHSRGSPPPCAPSPRSYRAARQQCSQLPSRVDSFGVGNSTHTHGSRLCGENQLGSNVNFSISETVRRHPLLHGCNAPVKQILMSVPGGWDFYSLWVFFPAGLVLCTRRSWHVWPVMGGVTALLSVGLLLGGISYCRRCHYHQA